LGKVVCLVLFTRSSRIENKHFEKI
jgi:hypothetical protein